MFSSLGQRDSLVWIPQFSLEPSSRWVLAWSSRLQGRGLWVRVVYVIGGFLCVLLELLLKVGVIQFLATCVPRMVVKSQVFHATGHTLPPAHYLLRPVLWHIVWACDSACLSQWSLPEPWRGGPWMRPTGLWPCPPHASQSRALSFPGH